MTTTTAAAPPAPSTGELPAAVVAQSASSHSKRPARPWQHALASQVAGALSTLVFYPLDVVKTRFMAQDGTAVRQHNGMRYTGVASAVRTMVREEGGASLFRGAHVAVGASALSWGAYMFVYRSTEEFALQALSHRKASEVAQLSQATRLQCGAASGFVAGAAVSALTNPLWLLKARMQLAAPNESHYLQNSLWKASLHIARTEGVSSLWRGTSAQVLTGIPNSLQYPLYDGIKRLLIALRRSDPSSAPRDTSQQLNAVELTACTVLSKFTLAVASHPLQVLKARLMDQKSRVGDVQYKSLCSAVVTTVRREGVIGGLYRGFRVSLAHTVPRNVAQFGLYELVLSLVAAQQQGDDAKGA